MLRLRHVQAGGCLHLRTNATPHAQLALKLARFGDWTSQPDLAESRAEDILLALGAGFLPTVGAPLIECPLPRVRSNYRVLVSPCAKLCVGDVTREVTLLDDEQIGRLVQFFVPQHNSSA